MQICYGVSKFLRYRDSYSPFFPISSSWVPCSAIPSSVSTSILPALRIVLSLWAMTNVVLPSARSSRESCTTFSLSLSRADVASSKIRICGFLRNTLAMDSRCYWPPESFTPLCPISVWYSSGRFMINSWALARFAALTTSSSDASGLP